MSRTAWACLLAWAAAAAVLCAPATAQTLYGAAAPPGAAYVRLFRTAEVGRPVVLGPARFEAGEKLSAYRPVPPDVYLVRADGSSAEIIPRAGGYYTVALTRGGIRVFEDAAHTDPARAQLVLYNLSALAAVGLDTEDGTRLIPPLAPGGSGRITVNAVPVRLSVAAGGVVLDRAGDPGLRRGSSYSLFVFDEQGRTSLLLAEAALDLN